MRILVLTGGFLPQIGGAELAVHNLCEGLVKYGQEVMVGTPTAARDDDFKHSYSITRYYTPRGLYRTNLIDSWLRLCISRQASAWKPDAIIANFAWPVGYAALSAIRRSVIPVVVISHGEDIQKVPSLHYGFRLNPRLDKKIRWSVCNADGLIAISDKIYNEYIAIGAAQKNIRIIPNGINYDLLSHVMPEAREKAGIAENRKVILAVGRNHPIKGFSELIRMMPAIVHEVPTALLVIVGKNVPYLSELVNHEGLSESVRLVDEKLPVGIEMKGSTQGSDQSITLFFKAADVYAMPSIIEGLPVAAIEAMASGLPVVSFSIPGSIDLISDRLTGRLVPPGAVSAFSNALLEILTGDEERLRMSRNAATFAQKFKREVTAKQVIDFLHEIGCKN